MNCIVSFIIPVFNEKEHIGPCLQSIWDLKIPKEQYEIIVMDNGSFDGTHEILKKLNVFYEVIENCHVSSLRNRGAAIAQGRFLAFIDADIQLSPYWAEKAISYMKTDEVVAVGSFPRAPENSTWVGNAKDIHQRQRFLQKDPISVSWLPSANFLVRKKVFVEIGGFNENLETGEDVDLGYRLDPKGLLIKTPDLDAIHWGEDQDLQTLWKKEVWRGRGSVGGVLAHGIRWDEVPSLGYPLFLLLCTSFLPFGIGLDAISKDLFWVPITLFGLMGPALGLALRTASLIKQPKKLAPLFALYFVYGMARAYALLKEIISFFVSKNVHQVNA